MIVRSMRRYYANPGHMDRTEVYSPLRSEYIETGLVFLPIREMSISLSRLMLISPLVHQEEIHTDQDSEETPRPIQP
jgi:hypothetical protein